MASADDARAFPLSSLSPELRAMLTIPPASRAPPGDPDEGWGFTDDGRIDWRRAPAPPPAGDARASADALKGLARACLRRARASPPGPSDGAPRASRRRRAAAHARLLERLRDDLRANRDPYLVLARSLSVLDRRCVDLHASVVARSERGGSPLLRDVLASASFAAALCGDSGPIEDSAGAWPLRTAQFLSVLRELRRGITMPSTIAELYDVATRAMLGRAGVAGDLTQALSALFYEAHIKQLLSTQARDLGLIEFTT